MINITSNYVTNSFADYSDLTKSFAQTILNYINDKFNGVPEMFKHSIHILLTNYEVFQQAREDVLRRGCLIEVNGETKKNPAFKIMQDSQIFLNNQLGKWGLTPRELKQLDNFGDSNQTDLMKILDNLDDD